MVSPRSAEKAAKVARSTLCVGVAAMEKPAAPFDRDVGPSEIIRGDRSKVTRRRRCGRGANGISRHDRRAAVPCAESFLQFVGGGADDADSVERDLQRVGAHLREYRLMALSGARRTDIDIEHSIRCETNPRLFFHAAGAALDERSKADAMVPAVDLAALDGAFFGPADLRRARCSKTALKSPESNCAGSS